LKCIKTHFGISSFPGRWSDGGRKVVEAGVGRTRGGTGPSVKAGVAAATPPVEVADLLFAFSAAAAEAALVAPTEISCLLAGEREFMVYFEIEKNIFLNFKTNNFNTGRYYFVVIF
jgi:hypothetical protein